MPHARAWRNLLVKSYGKVEAQSVIRRAENFFDGFIQQVPLGTSSDGQKILKGRVYPGLAVYRSLLEIVGDQETVLEQMEPLFKASFVNNLLPGIRLLNLLPEPFPIVRHVMRKMAFEPDGVYEQELVVDNRDTFAFNTHKCIIHQTLLSHDAGELTQLFCSTDDWLAAALSKVRWERTQTLGRGGDYCDFRWGRTK
jgi:hypothetical protein